MPPLTHYCLGALLKGATMSSFSFGLLECRKLGIQLPRPKLQIALKVTVCLFNTSIERSQFPDSWKLARVTPIVKEGDKAEKSNYRPISVLPVISRLFEKPVARQLYQHMNMNGYFSSEQSGFCAFILL